MVKSKIIKKLHQKHTALKLYQIETIVDIMFDSISKSLIIKKSVELRDFGRFSVKTIKAKYNARNPKTGEVIYVPKREKVSFKMSKNLKTAVNKIIER